MQQFNLIQETFLSMLKYFLICLIINNLIWLGVFISFNQQVPVEYSQVQDGTGNNQEMSNAPRTKD